MATQKIEKLLMREELKKKRKEEKKNKRMERLSDPTLFRNRFEFSKFITIVAIIIFTLISLWSMIRYYNLVELAISSCASVLPDATLPVTAITTIIGSVLTYLIYQGSLKLSLNKHGLKKDYKSGSIKAIIAKDVSTILNNAIDEDLKETEEETPLEANRSEALAGEPVINKEDLLD